jgi:hypothetical protein
VAGKKLQKKIMPTHFKNLGTTAVLPLGGWAGEKNENKKRLQAI